MFYSMMCDCLQVVFFYSQWFQHSLLWKSSEHTHVVGGSLLRKNEKWFFWSFESCLPKLRAFENLLTGFLLAALLGAIPETATALRQVGGGSTCEISLAHFYLLQNTSLHISQLHVHVGGWIRAFVSLQCMLHCSESKDRFAAPAMSV